MRKLMLIFALGVAASPAPAEKADRKTYRVEVNGKKYRVTTVGTAVIVANKALSVGYDVAERDDQRAAVFKATGCKVFDELPSNDARLRGKIECPSDIAE